MPYEPTPPEVDTGTLNTDLDDIISDLTAHDLNLTTDERKNANSFDADRLGFVTDYYDNKGDYPTLLPGFMNEADADAHNTLRIALDTTRVKALRVLELVEDIQINSEHFTMEFALEGYSVAGRAKNRNVPGADTFYDLLSRHFADQGGPGETPPDEEPDTPAEPTP